MTERITELMADRDAVIEGDFSPERTAELQSLNTDIVESLKLALEGGSAGLTNEELTQGLKDIAKSYQEHRSDVEDMITNFLETGEVDESIREHRYASFTRKGEKVTYDTLRTLFEVETDEDTIEITEIEYYD